RRNARRGHSDRKSRCCQCGENSTKRKSHTNMKTKNQNELTPGANALRNLLAKRITSLLVAVAGLAGVVACMALAAEHDKGAAAIFVKEIPAGYRDWKVVSVAHEAGDLNDIRAVLGNDIAINAYREGKLPFPEGAIVGRIAWSHVPSE